MFAIVSDADRSWAMNQRPDWARAGGDYAPVGEIVDDGGWLDDEERDYKQGAPDWFDFVCFQAERFEKHFEGQMKPREEWSRLWRYGWWPKAKPELRFPSMAKKKTQPFFRKGTQEFAIALRLASDEERRMWVRFGVAQFKPDEPRLVKITNGAKKKEAAE